MAIEAFDYTLYVASDARRIWEALTDPAMTGQYWGVRFDTDWQPGSLMTWEDMGARVSGPQQRVVEAMPGRRLAYMWHTFTEEWAQVHGFGTDVLQIAGAEPVSMVTFDIEQLGPTTDLPVLVKLTVTHDGFPENSAVRASVTRDWPAVLSSLKSLVETGSPLPSVHAYSL